MASPSPKREPSRLRRYARRAAIGTGALLAAVILLAAGALFSLRLASVRRFVVAHVNQALVGAFKGRVVVHNVQALGLGGVAAADVEIFDPSGKRVIDLHGVDVQLSVPTIVWAALTKKSEPLTLRLAVSLRHAEVVLIDDGAGSPTLADAFLPKTPSPPSSGPGTIVIIDQAMLGHVWTHGTLAGTPALDLELQNARGSLRLDAERTALELKNTGLRARGLPAGADPVGQLQASLDIPSAPGKPLGVRAHFQGSAVRAPVVLDAAYIDSGLKASLVATGISPAAIAAQVPALELRSPSTLTASVDGKLPDLHGTFALGVGADSGKIDGDFKLSLSPALSLEAQLKTRGLDLAELSRSGPISNLDLSLRAGLTAPPTGPMTGHFELATESSLVALQRLPPVTVSGTFSSDSKAQRQGVQAHAEIAEPGAQTGVDATVFVAQKTTLEFRSTTHVQSPPRLKKLAGLQSASGELTTQGNYQVDDRHLNAQVHADLRGIQQAENRIARARLEVTIAGALPHPSSEALLELSDARLAGQQLTQARIAARGSLSHLGLSAEVATKAPVRQLQVSALVSNDQGIVVDHPSLNLRQGQTNLHVSAERVAIVNGRTKLVGMRLEGAGSADVSLEYGSTIESIHAQTYALDLARLWHLIDESAPLKSGNATVSASYERRPGGPILRLKGQTQDLAFGQVVGGSLKADLDFDQGHLAGSARADLKQLGQTNFDFQDLRGIDVSNLDPARMTGKVAVEGEVRLKDLLDLVPKGVELPVGRALGLVKYDMAVERERATTGLPTFHVHVSSQKLQLAGRRQTNTELKTKAEARAAAPLAIKGIDVDLDLKHAESGETEFLAGISDERGKLLTFSVEAMITSRIANVVRELSSQWPEIPLRARLSIPRRDLGQLPIELRPAALSGVVSADFACDGRLDAPALKLSGAVENLRQVDAKLAALDLTWQGEYAGARGTLNAHARAQGRDVVKADIDFETAIGAWLKRVGATAPAFDANAQVNFDNFSIGLLPAASTGHLDGGLSGKLSLEHFGTNAALAVNLDAQSLKLGNTALGRIHSELTARTGKADMKLRIEGSAGTTTAEAHSGVAWGARFVPEVQVPADAELHARELRLAAFSPFLTSVFGEVDGRLNGDLNAHFREGAPQLDGHADLKDGLAQVASVGQRFDQITARVSLEPGKAKLESLSARATSGKLKVTGEARFAGLTLTGADAQLRIDKREKVSLSLAGTEIGDTWGAVDVKLRPGGTKGSQALSVDIPEMHVRLPDTGSQSLQDLDAAKGVRVGTRQRDGAFVTLPLQPLTEGDPAKNDNPMQVNLHLGDQVFIQQGDTTKIQLTGQTAVVLGDPLSMTGQINVKGGKLDVSGKQFEIESGVVTFTGEPSNPTIVATARWDAQDDEHHRVYADASGTAADLKVNLRSEPPLTKDQVLSLIVTGSADGSLGGSGSGGGGTAATAVGAVGGAATQGINKALSSISALDVSTRVDTSTGSARPELVIQVSPRVSAQITRALGEPAPGQPPDLTFLTLNFRVLRSWSLSALVGDRGESGLDLVWRRRY